MAEKRTFSDRLVHGWNAFIGNQDLETGRNIPTNVHVSYGSNPIRTNFGRASDKSIVNSITTHIAIAVAQVKVQHVRLDKDGRYIETIDDDLNTCLTLSANIDQTHRSFFQQAIKTMLKNGVVAIVPTKTDFSPLRTGSYNIQELRVGKITAWYPQHVKVKVYNDETGKHEELYMPKSLVAIVENPFYEIMNEPNSNVQRLIRKLNLIDAIDEQSGSGKLDLIIQLPYAFKNTARKKEAEERKKDIEEQLKGPFGIAYTDATEKITQINRPIENNLMKQIEYLTNLVYSELGITQEIMNGTASDAVMLNFTTNTVEPIIAAIVNEMKRKFLTKTARSQGQSIMYFNDPFRLVPVGQLAEIADKMTRNEIMSSNEFRQILGYKPSDDPKADELVNANISQPADRDYGDPNTMVPEDEPLEEEYYKEGE